MAPPEAQQRVPASAPPVAKIYLTRSLFAHPQPLSKIASAASFARGTKSPAGPTHDGHPSSHSHPAINSRVFSINNSCARNNGSLNPIPPGYASYKYRFGSKNSLIFPAAISSNRTGANSASLDLVVGGRSPIAVPKSRASHIKSSVATDSIAGSN